MRKLPGRIATTLLACGMSMAISAPTLAEHGPDGEVYEETRGHAGRNGAWSENVTSCVGEDGTVYHRSLDKRADLDGETTRDRRSGNPRPATTTSTATRAEATRAALLAPGMATPSCPPATSRSHPATSSF